MEKRYGGNSPQYADEAGGGQTLHYADDETSPECARELHEQTPPSLIDSRGGPSDTPLLLQSLWLGSQHIATTDCAIRTAGWTD